MVKSSSTSSITLTVQSKNMARGSSSLPMARLTTSNPHSCGGSPHTVVSHQLFLLLSPVRAQAPRRCGNSSKSKPSTKICMIKRNSSGRKALVLRLGVVYTGAHRFLHSHSTLEFC